MGRTFTFTARDGRPGAVRAARSRDARACLRIVAEAVAERPRTLAVLEEELWSPREWRRHRLDWSRTGVSLVAEIEGKVVGQLTARRGLRPVTEHGAEWGITVASAARSLGVGRALIEVVELWAKEVGVSRLAIGVFSTNERAHRLYRALGYVDEGIEHAGIGFPEGPVDVVRMYKLIGASRSAPGPDYDERPRPAEDTIPRAPAGGTTSTREG